MKILTANEIKDMVYNLENKYNVRLSTDQKTLIQQNYQEFGIAPTDRLFKALVQRETDLMNDERAKRVREKEKRLIEKKNKELIDMFPALQQQEGVL